MASGGWDGRKRGVLAEREAAADGSAAAPHRTRRDPERTKAAIIGAAVVEFAERGYGGGRVDRIVARAGVNQNTVYYHFYDKAALYGAVLDHVHGAMRLAEEAADPPGADPVSGVAALVRSAWERHVANRAFVSLLTCEDALLEQQGDPGADAGRPSSPLVRRLAELLRRGERSGAFRRGVDPVLVYLTISSLCLSYLSRDRVLSAMYGRDLATPSALAAWGDHIVAVVLAMVHP